MIRHHAAVNLSIEKDDFELAPFNGKVGRQPSLFMTVRDETAKTPACAKPCAVGRPRETGTRSPWGLTPFPASARDRVFPRPAGERGG
jgi:hypothetical protein